MSSSQPTVALFPEPGAWGPTNNLVALGNHLRERGIRTVFVIEESFEGELAKRGFEERLMRMAPPPEGEEAVGANPLEITDADIPPVFSGYPSRDRAGWDDFRVEYRRLTDPLVERSSAFHQQCGAPPLPDGEFQYASPYLNLYMYPAELDYERSRPLGSTWHRIDTATRNSTGAFDVAEKVGSRDACSPRT